MIIRSQDKKSITSDLNLFIDDFSQDEYLICNYKMDNLGKYSTEEKAIKALDKICDFYFRCDGIFEMPLDSEV